METLVESKYLDSYQKVRTKNYSLYIHLELLVSSLLRDVIRLALRFIQSKLFALNPSLKCNEYLSSQNPVLLDGPWSWIKDWYLFLH